MVSFRKMSMAFAGCLLAGGIASAQVTPIVCTVSATSPAIKLEGLTEPIGDVSLSCKLTGPAAATAAGVDLLGTFQLQSDGPQFTNTIFNKDTRELTGPVLSVGAAPSAIKGKLSSDGKSVTFNLINLSVFDPLVAGGADNTQVITITGLKINAQQSQGNLTSPKVKVSAISYNDATKPISLVNETQPVGTVQQAVVFAGKAAKSNLDCNAYSPDTDALEADTAAGALLRKDLAKVTFEANFPNSLDASKLTARFKVPSKAKLFVATSNTDANGVWLNAGGADAYALKGADEKVFVEVTANDDGIYEAVWTVSANGNGTATYYFPVFITIPQNLVSAEGLSAVGSIGPFSTVTTATDDGDVPATRFITPTASSDLISVGSCKTTLLFPYVTNVGNWDTGIAITNPTADMKNDEGKWASGAKDTAKVGQNGTCTLYFVGAEAPEKAIKSSEVKAGETVAFLVSGGSEAYGIAGVPGFNGYLKVQCSFSEGRGFAFMSSSDLGGVGVGYVAEKGITLVP